MEIDKTNLHAVLYALGELKAYKTLSNMERNDAIEAMNKLNSNGINLSFIFTEVKIMILFCQKNLLMNS